MQTRDHPLLENENYLEGYFHGGLGRTPIKSLKPRDGQWMDKPAAPPRLRAFIQVLLTLGELSQFFPPNLGFWPNQFPMLKIA